MKRLLTRFLFGLAIILSLSSCATSLKSSQDADLISIAHDVTSDLLASLKERQGQQSPVIVASFVNVDDTHVSSTFGRISAEQFASSLADHGLIVIEMKMRQGSVFIKEGTGELVLSRELQDISRKHNAETALVGTYAVGSKYVYVTVKLVNTRNNFIMASNDYVVPLGPNTAALINR